MHGYPGLGPDDLTPPFGFPLPDPAKSRRRVWLSVLAGVLALVLVAAGYTVVRHLVDNGSYDTGHAAYERADCAAAIDEFDSVINSWKPIQFGDAVTRSEAEKAECQIFQEAAKLQDVGHLPGALTGYAQFLPGRPKSPLTEAARTRIADLFGQPEPGKLATTESCESLRVLREEKLLTAEAAPAFYAGCGAAYVRAVDRNKALTLYATLFSEYGTSPVAAETEATMLRDVGWCPVLNSVRDNQVLLALPDLVPGLLLTCAKAPDSTADQAIRHAEEFLQKYPGHRLAPEMLATFAQLVNKRVRADSPDKDFGAADPLGDVGGDRGVLLIYNDSTESMRIALTGPEPRVEEIAGCPDCPKVTEGGTCRKQATEKRIVLAPGEYDIALEYPKSENTAGGWAHWTVEAGKQYFGCFTVVDTPR
jgi:hypothetical protein